MDRLNSIAKGENPAHGSRNGSGSRPDQSSSNISNLGKRPRETVGSTQSEPNPKHTRPGNKLSDLWTGFHRIAVVIRVLSNLLEKPWGTGSGRGSLFTVLVGDSTAEIKVIAFNKAVEQFRDKFIRGSVLELNCFSCKVANETYRTTVSRMEIVLSISSTVKTITDVPENDLLYHRLYTNLRSVTLTKTETIVNICGIVTAKDEVEILTRRTTGEPIRKREVTLVDEDGDPLTLTLWENQVDMFKDMTTPVISVSNVKIRLFKGRASGSLTDSSLIDVTEKEPRAQELRKWWTSRESTPTTTPVSIAEERTFLSILESEPSAPKFFSFWNEVEFTMVKSSGCLYKACVRNGCQKKLQERNNGELVCPKCTTSTTSFKWRILLKGTVQDGTHEVWVTTFHEVGPLLNLEL